MDEDYAISLDGNSLTNLRVIDLKQELEKRGLSKSGSKKDLVKRLKQQLEFEKLCEERKTAGENDLKLQLDAVTEQNEFVQQYLAQQQKIYAEQKEVKRLVELEEIQKSGDEHESCDSKCEADSVDQSSEDKLSGSFEKSNQNECNVKCDTSSGDSAEPSSSDAVSMKNSDDSFHVEVVQEETLVDSGNSYSASLQEPIISGMDKPKKLSTVSNVPYSLSDIQLPDSPGKCLVKSVSKSLDVKKTPHTKKYRSRFDVAVRDVDTHEVPSNGVSSTGDVKEENEQQDTEPNVEHLTNVEHKSSKSEEQKKIDIEEKENIENVVSEDCDNKTSPVESISSEANVTQSGVEVKQSLESQSITRTESTESKTKTDRTRSEKKLEVTESEAKAKVVELETKIKVTESDAKAEVTKSEAKTEVTKSDVTAEITKLEAEVKVTESETKAEVTESEAKAEVTVSEAKPEVTESEVKAVVIESDTKAESSKTIVEVTKSETKVKSITSEADKEMDMQEKEPDSPDDNEKSSESDDHNNRSRSSRRVRRKRSKSESSDSSTSQSSESSVERKSTQVKDSESHSQNLNETKESEALSLDVPEKMEAEEVVPVPKIITFRRLKIKRSSIVHQQKQTEHEAPSSDTAHEKESSISTPEICETQPDAPEKQPETIETKPETLEKQPEALELQSEETANVPQKPVELPVLTSRKLSTRKLNRKSISEEDKSEEMCPKKSRWGSYSSTLQRSSISISTNSLKNLIPDFTLITGPISSNDADDILNPVISGDSSPVQDTPSNAAVENETVHDDIKDETSKTVYKQLLAADKEQQPPKQQHPAKCPSPQAPVSKIIFVRNLVRPFTLLQLKELLRQTGNIIEESFWIDKIKSKCYVEYETEEEAVNTRLALNGTRWPSSNPKILFIDYANQEELDVLKGVGEPAPVTSQKVPATPEVRETRIVLQTDDHKKKERERDRRKEKSRPHHPVREWDKDKISQDSPERERGPRDVEKVRSAEKKDKKESKKRPTEDTPAKLLDDLFKKTKASPCIYWLPLTEEQVKQKKIKDEEEKKQRVIEREKRNQLREQEEAERRNRRARPAQRSHERETRKSPNRSRSPVVKRR